MTSSKEQKHVQRRDREVLLVKDLDDRTLEAIQLAEPSERSNALNQLMNDE